MTQFLQQLINGLSIGSVYALMAVGYSLVYSIMNFSNFAHGGVIMLGAYFGFFALTTFKLPFAAAFALAAARHGPGRRPPGASRLQAPPRPEGTLPLLHHLRDGRLDLPGEHRHRDDRADLPSPIPHIIPREPIAIGELPSGAST